MGGVSPQQVTEQSERNYCVTLKELLAVVVAVKTYHHYLCRR